MNRILSAVIALAALLGAPSANAKVIGVTGVKFELTAKADTISTSDGDSMWMWGYAFFTGRMQYPGPTMIVDEGEMITITLNNTLPVPVSMVFPGLDATAYGGVQGALTREVPAAAPGATTGPVTYRIRASHPGTYTYFSGSHTDLEVEMGLVGAIIVRPKVEGVVVNSRAYADKTTDFDQEYLFLLTEADPAMHQQVALACGPGSTSCDLSKVDFTRRHASDWFINGRNFPDTLVAANDPMFPTQPYSSAPLIHPGERILIRWVGGGADLHPFHTHGQNHVVIARDGRLLASAGSDIPNLGVSDYTTTVVPGQTIDAIWGPWTGEKLGWDAYGTQDVNPHECVPAGGTPYDALSREYCPDHNKPIPVSLPSPSDVNFGVGSGGMWGGTPYLGVSGDLPPINPGQNAQLNVGGGYSFMWHSHAERELTTNNIFIGGMATMAVVVPMSVAIP